MASKKEAQKTQIVEIQCPCCKTLLWVDPLRQEAVQLEKGEKQKKSLEKLLLLEKKKKQEADRKFTTTAELEKEKRKAAEEKFREALSRLGKRE